MYKKLSIHLILGLTLTIFFITACDGVQTTNPNAEKNIDHVINQRLNLQMLSHKYYGDESSVNNDIWLTVVSTSDRSPMVNSQTRYRMFGKIVCNEFVAELQLAGPRKIRLSKIKVDKNKCRRETKFKFEPDAFGNMYFNYLVYDKKIELTTTDQVWTALFRNTDTDEE